MELIANIRKGGRPRKEIKRIFQLTVVCTQEEKKIIQQKAVAVHLSVSEYLRLIGLTGKTDLFGKVLPQKLLVFNAGLHQVLAQLFNTVKYGNADPELTKQLLVHLEKIMKLSEEIKNISDDR